MILKLRQQTELPHADNYNYIVFVAICFTNVAIEYAEIATVEKMFKIFLIPCAICIKMGATS